jgi:phage/plasmid-associated DNA primase
MENYEFIINVINQGTEYRLAELFYKICPNNIIYIKEDDKFYTWFNNKWNKEVKTIGSFSRLLIKSQLTKIFCDYNIKICSIKKHQPEELETEEKDKNTRLLQKVSDILALIEKTTWKNNIWTELQSFIISSPKDIKFDDNPNVIAFNNLKYDFIKKEFSKIQHDDYITMYSNYDWVEPEEEQMKIIDKLFEEIFPNTDRRECYLSVLYSCCIGGVKDKFIIANGDGGNGKGVLNELTYDMLGDYSYEGNTNVLTEKIKNGANPELAHIDKKRMVIYKEFNKEDKLRLDVLKKLVDNEVINARGLYSSKTETKLEATNIMEVNSRIKFSGKISGDSEARRLVDVLFESTFTDKPDVLNDTTRSHVYEKDKRFKAKEFKQNHRCALFKYIIEKARKEIYVPPIVEARTNEYIDKNDDLLNWFNDNYELTTEETDIVKIKEVFDLYKESDEYQALYKKERPNLSIFTEDIRSNKHLRSKYKERLKIQKNNTTLRSVLQGVRQIYNNDNDSDEE